MTYKEIRQHVPGITLVSLVGVLGWINAPLIPFANEVILGLLFGILLANLFTFSPVFSPGIKLISGKGLEIAILFLSFSIDYRHIGAIGWKTFLFLVIVMALMMAVGVALSKRMKCPGQSGILISFGTLICGSSAIAALAPQINASQEDTGISMAVINLLGTLFMLVLPISLVPLLLNPEKAALLVGGSLHAVGNVAGAGYSMGQEVGELSVTIKLARIALLSPALVWMQFLMHKSSVSTTSFKFKLPWYLLGFLLITLINSLIDLPEIFLDNAKLSGEFILTIAMVAIGMKIRFRELLKSGKKGLVFGLVFYLLFFGVLALGLPLLF
ncbi:MAG: putative sulfate exporter family transporter [Bacteroidetes bacterium]|nr:putative sulfate exporter family transporter [Bacteroidota bacterium]